MVGTLINAAAILAGGVAGLTVKKQIPPVHQTALKVLLGAFTVYVGLSATWQAINGSFPSILKQLCLVLLSLVLGNLTGKLIHAQKSLNHLGQYAKQKIAAASSGNRTPSNDGFITCSILFCLTPIAVLGSLLDGLGGNFTTLVVKAVMDGLATMAFVPSFGWSAIR